MPEGFADIFQPVFEGWVEGGFTIIWGTVGLTLKADYEGRLKTVLEIAPNYICLYSRKWEKSRELTTHICEKYRIRVAKNEFATRSLNENRSYVTYKDMSLEDFGFILNESDDTARELIQFYEEQGARLKPNEPLEDKNGG